MFLALASMPMWIILFQEEVVSKSGQLGVSVTGAAGEPLPDAVAELFEATPEPYSGKQRRLTWKNGGTIPYGEYELRVSHPGFSESRSRVGLYSERKGLMIGLNLGRIHSGSPGVWISRTAKFEKCSEVVMVPLFITGGERRRERLQRGRTHVTEVLLGSYVAMLFDDGKLCSLEHVRIDSFESTLTLGTATRAIE